MKKEDYLDETIKCYIDDLRRLLRLKEDYPTVKEKIKFLNDLGHDLEREVEDDYKD